MRKNGIKTACISILVAAALLCGCGNDDAAAFNESSGTAETLEAKPIKEIYEEIGQSVALYSPVEMADNFISNYYGIDTDKLEEYVFVMSEEATSAETIVIMKVKDDKDIEEIVSALQVVIDGKRGEMENYLPKQFEIVDKSSVKSKGNYVYLVISESREAIEDIIEKGI